MSEEEKKAIEIIKKDNEYFEKHNIKTNASILLNLIEKQQKEIEKKDKKLKAIKNHIETEINIIEKCYNEVNLFLKQQYDGMIASYKCLLNIFF